MKIYFLIFSIFLFSCSSDIRNPNISFKNIPNKAQIGYPIVHKVTINDLEESYILDSIAWEDSSAWLSDSSKVFIKDTQIDTLRNSIFINYLHNKYNSSCSKIASVVEISTNDTKKASEISDNLKVLAMQVSAMKPMGLNEESLDTKVLDDEKDIILKQIENTPDDKKEQIVKGKLNKFIKENTLMGQALITDPKNTVTNYLSDLSKSNNLDLNIVSMDLYTI